MISPTTDLEDVLADEAFTAREMLNVARAYARRVSDDPDTKVGVVLRNNDRGLLECNRLPPGLESHPEYVTRPMKYHYIEHAERNAIAEGTQRWGSVAGMEMYLPWFPCADCARAMSLARIGELYCLKPDFDDPAWGASMRAALEILRAGGVEVFYVD